MLYRPNGAIDSYKPNETRRDVRGVSVIIAEALKSENGGLYLFITIIVLVVISFFIPFGAEFIFLITILIYKLMMQPEKKLYNFPWRVPIHAKIFDGSVNKEILDAKYNGDVIANAPEKLYGEGVTYYGVDRLSGLPVYSTNSDDRTHLTCLGTTGSGKTEFLLALVNNQLIQNSGLIYIDAKGDPALQQNVSRLALRYGRQDDVLTMNFITSGLNLSNAQPSKITNTFNLMANTSDGMLIETLSNLLDSGSGGSDMWLGRALAFLSALTKVLVYLRDGGYILLSPATYDQHMQLPILEELVYEHNNKFGEFFPKISASLESYLVSIPAFNTSPKARKKQSEKTVEQHGYIAMQLTRAIGDLTYAYGHIFGVKQGDIDIFDCVLNRRILTIPLPALERSKASIEMLGKLIIGSIKQMMASSLGNRLEGMVREILDSRPTNAPNAYKVILDEVGYILSNGIGVSIMPAQGRSLSFSIAFAGQDFSDLKRGDDNEAESIWGNSNVKAIGKIVSGDNGDTMQKVNGVTGEIYQARSSSTELNSGDFFDTFMNSSSMSYSKERVLPYSDLYSQTEGEFTLLISKKIDGGVTADGRIIRISSFYVASPPLKYLRMNDLCPNFSIPKDRIPNTKTRIEKITKKLIDDSISSKNKLEALSKGEPLNFNLSQKPELAIFDSLASAKIDTRYAEDPIERLKVFLGVHYFAYLNDVTTHLIGGEQHSFAKKQPRIVNQVDEQAQFIDESQTDIQNTLDIAKAVSKPDQFSSQLEANIIKDAKPVEFGTTKNLPISAINPVGIQPVSILKLMEYTQESSDRLKNHGIDFIKPDIEHSLTALIPSQLFDAYEDDISIPTPKTDYTTAPKQAKAKANSILSRLSSVDTTKVKTKKPLNDIVMNNESHKNIEIDKRKTILELVTLVKSKINNHWKFK